MPSSIMSKRFNIPALLLVIAAAPLIGLQPLPTRAQSLQTPDQHRLALIQALRNLLPDSTPDHWRPGASGSTELVQAIALNSDNATNSADILAIGKKLWERKFKNGKSLASCFPNAGKRVAVTYPQFDPKSKRVVTQEMALNRCFALHGESEIALGDAAVIGPLGAYFRSLSEGQKLNVRVGTPQAREKFDAGRALFSRRMGQQNYACASCHVLNAGRVFGQQEISPAVGQALSWPHLQPGGKVLALQKQFQQCMLRTGAEPFPLGSDELNNLEYYHAFISNGLPIRILAVQR
ncbi:MAG: sulfur oxidation c-type cytochrome SoxA [Betaproteobacteria bacterium]